MSKEIEKIVRELKKKLSSESIPKSKKHKILIKKLKNKLLLNPLNLAHAAELLSPVINQ